jgi:NADPH2:quinone reductase
VVGSSTKIEYAEQFGYDQILVSDKGLDERFAVVLDSVGGQTRRASLELLAPQGRLAAYGNASGAVFSVSTTELNMQNKAVLGYSSFNLSQTHPQPLADSGRRALELVASGQVRLDITAEYDLADLATAVQRIADRATAGKSVPRITKV